MAAEIDPWGSAELTGNEKQIREFGLQKFPKSEKPDHYLFERNIIVAHRDFGLISKAVEEKSRFIQMTGIATSGPLHLGHKVDVDSFLYFNAQGAKSLFGMADIDAYVSRPDSKVPSLQKAKENAADNIAHLLALGLKKEDIYVQSRREARYYEFAFELSKKFTFNMLFDIYGKDYSPGKHAANILQYADVLHQQLKEYGGPAPSLTGIGIDQDPHARAIRDIAVRLPYKMVKPSFIYFSHLPGLQEGKKMSSSDSESAIYLDDTPEAVRRKIRNAFSGGRSSAEEQKRLGGDPDVDRAYQILRYHHPDSAFVKDVYRKYKSGEMLTGELKQICIDFVTEFLKKHQAQLKRTRKVAEEMVFGK